MLLVVVVVGGHNWSSKNCDAAFQLQIEWHVSKGHTLNKNNVSQAWLNVSQNEINEFQITGHIMWNFDTPQLESMCQGRRTQR